MIEGYRDHAANERTYLAWIRTGVAMMGLGFVFERFDLFVRALQPDHEPSALARVVGLVMIVLGVGVLGISTRRYVDFRRRLASREAHDFRASRTDLVLIAVVGLIAGLVAGYVIVQALA